MSTISQGRIFPCNPQAVFFRRFEEPEWSPWFSEILSRNHNAKRTLISDKSFTSEGATVTCSMFCPALARTRARWWRRAGNANGQFWAKTAPIPALEKRRSWCRCRCDVCEAAAKQQTTQVQRLSCPARILLSGEGKSRATANKQPPVGDERWHNVIIGDRRSSLCGINRALSRKLILISCLRLFFFLLPVRFGANRSTNSERRRRMPRH